MKADHKISLTYLFLTFLKIGSISWGGYMALISVVQKQMVDKDKVIGEELILDGISLASVLPGPVAFNVVTWLGYHLRGIKGALVSMIGIILPSFILIILLATMYSKYGQIPVFSKFSHGILPAITAVILSVAFSMVQKQIKDYKQIAICALSAITLIFIHVFLVTLTIIIFSSLIGYFLYSDSGFELVSPRKKFRPIKYKQSLISIFSLIVLIFVLWFLSQHPEPFETGKYQLIRTIFVTFSGMSVTLFGGGYVIIPAMQQIIVDGLHWLTINQFSDAIAMGQITPGPIFISAAAIGYHVAGLLGASVATISIFFPPGVIMIIFSGFIGKIKGSQKINAIFKGMRPAIIGMIISAAFTIGKGAALVWPSAFIFLIVFVLLVKFKLSVVYLIPLSGLAGVLLF